MWWTINCQYTQWYNTISEVLSSEVTHNRTHSVIKSTMVLPLPLKYCQLPVNLQLLHYIDSGHFLTPYLLSTVSAYIVILLYMLSTGYGKFQFIHNGTYSTFEILSTNMTPNIVVPLPLMYFLLYLEIQIISEIFPIFIITTIILLLSLPQLYGHWEWYRVLPYLWSTNNCQYIYTGKVLSLTLRYCQLSVHP